MEDLQRATEEKNCFWSVAAEVKNPWVWTFVDLSIIVILVEEAAQRLSGFWPYIYGIFKDGSMSLRDIRGEGTGPSFQMRTA